MIDLETSTAMVKQLYPPASDPILSVELELTRGDKYRPYYVAAKFISMEYRRLIKADDVTFDYDIEMTLRSLLNRQKQLDTNDTSIPEDQTVELMLSEICFKCAEVQYLGVNVF
jgi:hypothetical protein